MRLFVQIAQKRTIATTRLPLIRQPRPTPHKLTMEKLSTQETAIEAVFLPTLQAYMPLLQAKASDIRSVLDTRETHQYGNHSRQSVDIYTPKTASKDSPIVIWTHGGGLVQGGKNLPFPGDLVHTNIGHFFGSQGFITIIPNYRLVNAHDAKFPSGGEDIAILLEWITQHFKGEKRDVFGIGNSAGGIHWSTYLLHPDFEDSLKKVTTGNGIRLRGVTLLSVPLDFNTAPAQREEILNTYYGTNVDEKSPYGLMTAANAARWEIFEQGNVQLNVVTFSLDPEDEVISPTGRFVASLKSSQPRFSAQQLTTTIAEGHNHISPVFAIGTGIEREEAWGADLAKWMSDIHQKSS